MLKLCYKTEGIQELLSATTTLNPSYIHMTGREKQLQSYQGCCRERDPGIAEKLPVSDM
jgi:hypothetical protein